MATINSEVATGLRINGFEGLTNPASHCSSFPTPQSSHLRSSPEQSSETPCSRSSTSPAHPPQSDRPASRHRSGLSASPRSAPHSPSALRHKNSSYSQAARSSAHRRPSSPADQPEAVLPSTNKQSSPASPSAAPK